MAYACLTVPWIQIVKLVENVQTVPPFIFKIKEIICTFLSSKLQISHVC